MKYISTFFFGFGVFGIFYGFSHESVLLIVLASICSCEWAYIFSKL